MPRPFIRLLPAVILLSFRADAGELRYGAALHEAAWEVTASRLECRMTQVIPHYGSAAFVRRAAGDLAFELRTRQGAPAAAAARLTSVPPAWMHASLTQELGTVTVTPGNVPLMLPAPMARRLLADLEQGLFPTVSYNDWADGRDQVVVAVSAVNLRKSLNAFHDCMAQLLPYEFRDVRRSTLLFPFAQTTLGPAMQAQLDTLVEYLRADASVRQVEVRGYTDNRGFRRQNRVVAERRATAVKDYLVAQGIAAGRISVKAFGESYPVATNRTEQGRSRNRRVELTLIR